MCAANVLGWPAGSVPITTVRGDEQFYDIENLLATQKDSFAREAKKVMEGSKGLPIGVQVMAGCYGDEVCLRVMKEVEAVVRFGDSPKAFALESKS